MTRPEAVLADIREARRSLARAICGLLDLEGVPLLLERELAEMALHLFNTEYYGLLSREAEIAEKLLSKEAGDEG